MTERKLHFVQHKDDEGLDEIVIMVNKKPFLRCIMVPRYKTSGLSGDEWRVSAMWEHNTVTVDAFWEPLDGPYRDIETASAAIFAGIYNSHKSWHDLTCTSIRLLRKGRPIIEMTHDGKSMPLLAALGHLPWTLKIWPQQDHGMPGPFGGDCTKDLCFQVGCKEPAVSTYLLKKRYDRDGDEKSAESEWAGRDARRFCAKHLRRGDCGLDDADANYEVHEGPGPDGHKMSPHDESKSVFGGIVNMSVD